MEQLNPSVHKVVQLFHMDKQFVKGESCYLVDEKGQSYTDFIAQYGALPLGYNPEAIWEGIEAYRAESIPSFCQPSIPYVANKLASELTRLFPDDLNICTFAQSGAEAVEAAIKLARASTRKEKILSCYKGFHGKTMGALSATGQRKYQEPFFVKHEIFPKIAYNDTAALEHILEEQSDQIAAFIVEPIQGEGGIRIPDPAYLSDVITLCRRYDVLVIVDEIQTGLGRLGNWTVTTEQQLLPDMVLLSKALGGGLVPISACISRSAIWTEDFGLNHSSTFANNNFTAQVGLSYIEYLKQNENLFNRVKQKGTFLKKQLKQLQEKWPGVIQEVRGKGLLIAVEFSTVDASDSFEIALMTSMGGFGYLVSGYLLNVEQFRVMPFLNESQTIRIQPPLTVEMSDIKRFIDSLDVLCDILYHKDYYLLYRYLTGDYRRADCVRNYRPYNAPIVASRIDATDPPTASFAFLCHYPSIQDMIKNTPSFEQFTKEQLNELLKWAADSASCGTICHMRSVRSPGGGNIEGWLIGVTYGGQEILERPRKEVVETIRNAVKLAKDLGADVVGLGAFTSIVTRGGYDLRDEHVTITTGNTLTIITAVEALMDAADKKGYDLGDSNIGVIGANGAIGKICALLLAQHTTTLTLIGRDNNPVKNTARLRELANEIYLHALVKHKQEKGIRQDLLATMQLVKSSGITEALPEVAYIEQQLNQPESDLSQGQVIQAIERMYIACGKRPPIRCSVALNEELPQLDLIITATSSMEQIISVEQIKSGAIICDVSRPANVGDLVKEQRNDVMVIEGGLVQYAEPIAFGQNLGYKPGVNLACLSETMLLAFEKEQKSFGIGGRTTMEDVYYVQSLAAKHHFRLADANHSKGSVEAAPEPLLIN